MKNRREKEMFDLAFGELKGADAEALLAEAVQDELLSKEIAQLRDIKRGLLNLSVPQHQLSTDRLRDAILEEGLQQKQRESGAPWWRFAWMPVAAAVLAVAGMQFVKGSSTADVVPIASVAADVVSSSAGSILDAPASIKAAESIASEPLTPVAATPAEVQTPSSGRVQTDRRPRSQRLVAMNVPSKREAVVDQLLDDMTSMATKAIATASAQPSFSPVESVDTDLKDVPTGIILIGSEKDSGTGANRAIEISDASNVVIGG